MPIPLLYSSAHHQHAPRIEYYHGRLLDYPEIPARIEQIKANLLSAGLVSLIEPKTLLPREAILKAHSADLVGFLETIGDKISDIIETEAALYKSTGQDDYLYPSVFPSRPYMMRLKDSKRARHGYFFFDNEAPVGKNTWLAAQHSATLAYEGAELLIQQKAKAAYALCRPPGHHAGTDFMGGYCYLNNAAIAAAHLTALGKVAILDIDYHHGNGTQAIFWDNPQVLFSSIHANPDEEYPYYSGYADETGGDGAPGKNINVPLPSGTTGEEYLAAFANLLERVMEFQPAALVLSVGFDTFAKDPLSTFKVTRETYEQLGVAAMRPGLPVLLVQEGGYQVEVLGDLAIHLLRGIQSGL